MKKNDSWICVQFLHIFEGTVGPEMNILSCFTQQTLWLSLVALYLKGCAEDW